MSLVLRVFGHLEKFISSDDGTVFNYITSYTYIIHYNFNLLEFLLQILWNIVPVPQNCIVRLYLEQSTLHNTWPG